MPTRRELLQSMAAGFVAASGCTAPSRSGRTDGQQLDADWPMFRYDARNTGYVARTGYGDGSPGIKWSHDTDGQIWGSPVVADGVLYVPSYDRHLYALDATTGDEIWRYRTGAIMDGTPAVSGGIVYFGSFDETLYAVDAHTGRERWSYDAGGIVRSSPTVDDGTLYVGSGCRVLNCQEHREPGLEDIGYVLALDAETGEQEWRYEAGGGVLSTSAVVGGSIYLGCSDRRVYSIDASTGEVEWDFETGNWVWSSPTVVGGTVYTGSMDGNIYALEASTGAKRWLVETDGTYVSSSPAVADDTMYIGVALSSDVDGNEDRGKVFAIAAENGDVQWTYRTGASEVGSSPAVTENTLVTGAHHGPSPGVYALTRSGEEIWRFEIKGRGVGSSPALADETVYVGTVDGRVIALE